MEKNKEKRDSEKTENIVAFAVVGILIFVFIGFGMNWWGLFEEETETENPVVNTPVAGEPVKGDPNAPITIVEYSDFECPFCGRFFRETYPLIEQAYIDTGKARLVFKQFPLTRIHANALNAALAAECAFRQGNEEFWKYHDLLFQNQHALDLESLKSYAGTAGLDRTMFDLCLSNGETEAEVQADFQEGVKAGVTGTPGFVIGETGMDTEGELIVGAHPFTKFSEVINKLE